MGGQSLIIVKVPFRISLSGGGTDLPSFYSKEPGAVISGTIDKSLCVMVRRQLGLVEHKYRLTYSKAQQCDTIDEIENTIAREAFRLYKVDEPTEVATWSEVPEFTGLGSSSAFAVGLVMALEHMKGQGKHRFPHHVAEVAAHIELNMLGRPVGRQDHYAAAFGGMNIFRFEHGKPVTVTEVDSPHLERFSERLLLLYTGIKRDAGDTLKSQNDRTEENRPTLRLMKAQVPAVAIYLQSGELNKIGPLLHDGWCLKRSLSPDVSNPRIDFMYHMARESGASGGKALGAGGGGFLLLDADPRHHERIMAALPGLYRVPFKFSNEGATIIFDSEAK